MAKRSDGTFVRRVNDAYATPAAAVRPLLPFLHTKTQFIEPCIGEGHLVRHLQAAGHVCVGGADIEFDARTAIYNTFAFDCFISNPPWSRDLLHPIIENLSEQAPTWLLFDAGWLFTKQAIPYLPRLRTIVTVGRVKWIEGSKHQSKDDCFWGLFHYRLRAEPPQFYGRA